MTSLFDRLSDQIEAEVHQGYVDESMLPLFPNAEDIRISAEKWIHKSIDQLPEAAVNRAGYRPMQAQIMGEEYGHYLYTVSEELRINEKDWGFYEENGISTAGIEQLGKKVARSASKFMMTGQDRDNTVPYGHTNYMLHAGAGTPVSPSRITAATGGAWATWANMNTDMTGIISALEAANYNIRNTMILYPKAASLSMRRAGANAREMSATEYFISQGVRSVVGSPNEYLWTAAGALPVIGAFDLVAIDLSQIKIGYSRRERTRVIAPHDDVRETVIQAEVWFVLYMKPQNIGGTNYKGVSTITAINGA